jgi:heme/flavin dehydrogenase (mycofactocin system)
MASWTNPWRQNPWFESVAVAQAREKRLPAPVFAAWWPGRSGVRRWPTTSAPSPARLLPHVVGQQAERSMRRTVLGHEVSSPVLISPTGVQAVHPDGEVAVARAANARGTLMALSNFASKPIEEVVEACPRTLFQMYWTGDRDVMVQRMERARDAGAIGLIATLDWSFSTGRDWGSPEIPEKVDLMTAVRMAPKVVTRPRWMYEFGRTGQIPDLTAPTLAPPRGGAAPTFFAAYYEWMTTPPPGWDDVAWMRHVGRAQRHALRAEGVCRVDDAKRAVDAGVDAISVSNHGGNNLDSTPAAIRLLQPIAQAVGSEVEVLLDGGVRRGADVVKALALGARRCCSAGYLWGLAANGQAGVENVLDIMSGGIDSALRGLALAGIDDLGPEHLLIPDDFHPNTAPAPT